MSPDNPILVRKSSVNFMEDPIQDNEVNSIIKAAMWAPSSRNAQPWRIIGVKSNSVKFNQIIECLSSDNRVWAKKSGLILIFSTKEIDEKFNPKIFLDIGFSGQNAMIEATRLGLETHPIGGWDEGLVKSVVNIPNESKVGFLLVVGKPGNEKTLPDELIDSHQKIRERNDVEMNFNYDQWGEKF